jgi:putative PIN family toxin of toxin-antitoxin system
MYTSTDLSALENDETAKIDRELEKITRGLDRQSRIYLKKAFDKMIGYFLDGNSTLTFVVDTNIVLSEAIRHAQNGRSELLSLVHDSPFLNVIAPLQIRSEVWAKLPEIAAKRKIQVEHLSQSANLILNNIKVMAPHELSHFQTLLALAKRDFEDVNFVALYFSSKADGLLTKDKDFTGLSEVKIWTVSKVGRVLTQVENGAFSLVVIGNVLPAILQFLYNAALYVLGFIYRLAVDFRAVLTAILERGINAILSSPALFLIVLGLIVYAKDSIMGFVQRLATAVKEALSTLVYVIKLILEFIAGFIKIGTDYITKLFTSIIMTLATYQSLRAKPAGVNV